MTSGSLLWTAGRLSGCCLPKSKCMHTTSLGHPGTVAWSCWSRHLLSLPTSSYCCKKCSAHRHHSSWRQRRLQLDWAQRSIRWRNLVTNTKVNISSVFIVVTTLCLFSGLPCICCWAVCKHGKLQVIWGHQIHPQPTKGHIPYLTCPNCALSEFIVISQRFKCLIILPILICRRSSRLWCGRVWPLNRALVTRRRCGAAAVSPFTP